MKPFSKSKLFFRKRKFLQFKIKKIKMKGKFHSRLNGILKLSFFSILKITENKIKAPKRQIIF
jgi:hypothetical protein